MPAEGALLWRVMAMVSLLACVSAADRNSRSDFQSRRGGERNRVPSLELVGDQSQQGLGEVRKLFQTDDGATQRLWDAANNNNTEDFRSALSDNPDVNAKLGTDGACPCTPLLIAANAGNLEIIQLLIQQNADLEAETNTGNATALFAAAQLGHLEIVQALIGAGADVNTTRQGGSTALIVASEKGHYGVVKVLIESGADVKKVDDNLKTPLHSSALTIGDDSAKIATALLDVGADVNALDSDNATPLMWAAYFGNNGVAKLLIERGADKTLKDNTGLDAQSQICACPLAAEQPEALTCPIGGCDVAETSATIMETIQG